MFWLRRSHIVVLMLLLGWTTLAQGSTVDSLWRVLQQTEAPAERFDLLCELALEYTYNQPDSAFILLQAAEQLRSEDISPRQIAVFHRRKALMLQNQSSFAEALVSIDSSLMLFRTLGDSTEVAKALVNKGAYFQRLDRLDEAFQYFQQGNQLLEGVEGEELALASTLNNMSVIYTSWGMHAEAIAALFEAIEIKERLNDHESLAYSYGTLASVYMARDEFNRALGFHKKALESAQTAGNRYLEAAFLFNLGSNYKDLDAFEQAETYMREARVISQSINNSMLLGHCTIGLAEVAQARGQLSQAKAQLEAGLTLDATKNSPSLRSNVLLSLAEIALEQNRLQEAERYGQEGLSIAKSIEELPFVSRGEELLANIYEQKGEPTQALLHYKAFKAAQDSLLGRNNSNRISQLEAQYDYQLQQKDFELQLSDKEKQLDRAANQAQRWYILFITLGMLVLASIIGVLLYLNRQHRHSQAELNDMNEELYQSNENLEIAYLDSMSNKQQLEITNHKLQQFVYAASHDLRDSISKIQDLSQLICEKLKTGQSPAQLREEITSIAENSQRMDKLLSDLLRYHQLEERSNHSAEYIQVSAVVELVKELCADTIDSTNTTIDSASNMPTLVADPAHIEQLFYNLISNSILYRSVGRPPQIHLGTSEREEGLIFYVQDNGLGIPKEHQEAIFQPFFRLHQRNNAGSGLGLAISQRIVQLYNGRIWVDGRSNGQGTRICFTLPSALTENATKPTAKQASPTLSQKENP
jgi:signal transduction histidine kinase